MCHLCTKSLHQEYTFRVRGTLKNKFDCALAIHEAPKQAWVVSHRIGIAMINDRKKITQVL